MTRIPRTDLAHEIASRKELKSGLKIEEATIGDVKITRVAINPEASARTRKAPGNYVTMFCSEKDTPTETGVLAHILSEMMRDTEVPVTGSVLVTGLGNENVTPDSLGVRSAGKVLATAHFADLEDSFGLNLRKVYVIQPGVMAQTGLESALQLKYIADSIQPDCLIVVDSLACSEFARLGTTIQITDTGISPGSGVKNQRREFSRGVFGVPVIAIGVPTVIDLETLLGNVLQVHETGNRNNSGEDRRLAMVVPRDIDVVINHFAGVISGAVNQALNPELDQSEIERLLM